MKKTKKPTKSKTGKEVKRPAKKKPRPKKYVEAKIPDFQPIQTKEDVPTKPVCPIHPKATKWPCLECGEIELANMKRDTAVNVVTLELPEGMDEARVTKLVNLANEELKVVAENAKEKADERAEFIKMQPIMIGRMTQDQKEEVHQEVLDRLCFTGLKAGRKRDEVIKPRPILQAPIVQPKENWFCRAISWLLGE